MSYILGLNAFHGDSSACIVQNGNLVAAAEEERFGRVKHWAGFPSQAIRYCLTEAGIGIEQVSYVAINQDHMAHIWKKALFLLSSRLSPSAVLDRVLYRKMRANVRGNLIESGLGGFAGEIKFVEHHLCHLASAFYVSSFRDAAVVSVDGFGDFASTAWGYGCENQLNVDDRVFFPHSLGIFYQALTQWLGFCNYGDEYKVMGLAPYGKPLYRERLQSVLNLNHTGSFKLCLDYFRYVREKVSFDWTGGEPVVGTLYSEKLVELLGPPRKNSEELSQYHKDIACSVQALYEDAFMNLLNAVHKKYGSDNLCLAGGCAMNSVANGKIYQNTNFKHIYIQSAAGDAGGAIGAAYHLWHKLGGGRKFVMRHSYWGPRYDNDFISHVLKKNDALLQGQNCKVSHSDSELDLYKAVAQHIADGRVVGWFQGRMEWGPRALGNRSILGDPRREDMKDILNSKIKRRESFRPFAPSILREYVADWFETDDDVPFMMQVFQIKPERSMLIPAVTHVDGSGRLQTVTIESNSRYYRLIQAFKTITGVPILLNTSFNENEPVVCTPQEALDCFLRTRMDVLVLEDYLLERH